MGSLVRRELGQPPRRRRILVVDDSEIASEVTRVTLERDGFEVRTVRSLDEFARVLRSWGPHIVLTDVNMPGMTGPQLCKWIKLRIETHSVPVVLYSGMPDSALEVLARDSGADAFVSKSKGLDRVSRRLSELCEEIVW